MAEEAASGQGLVRFWAFTPATDLLKLHAEATEKREEKETETATSGSPRGPLTVLLLGLADVHHILWTTQARDLENIEPAEVRRDTCRRRQASAERRVKPKKIHMEKEWLYISTSTRMHSSRSKLRSTCIAPHCAWRSESKHNISNSSTTSSSNNSSSSRSSSSSHSRSSSSNSSNSSSSNSSTSSVTASSSINSSQHQQQHRNEDEQQQQQQQQQHQLQHKKQQQQPQQQQQQQQNRRSIRSSTSSSNKQKDQQQQQHQPKSADAVYACFSCCSSAASFAGRHIPPLEVWSISL
ncbi:hypothetical protein ACSSS7_003228 [Eimeria intestinalis]